MSRNFKNVDDNIVAIPYPENARVVWIGRNCSCHRLNWVNGSLACQRGEIGIASCAVDTVAKAATPHAIVQYALLADKAATTNIGYCFVNVVIWVRPRHCNHCRDHGIVALLIWWQSIIPATHYRRENNGKTAAANTTSRTSTTTTILSSAVSSRAFRLYMTPREHLRILLLHG